MITRKKFIMDVAEKCRDDKLALFLGAGMSIDAGFPSWKSLFEPLASTLGINIDSSKFQLYDIAQFYANEEGMGELELKIKAQINRIDDESDALDELTNMQCNSVWTTNFDHAIENNYRRKGKIPNVIISEQNLINSDLNKYINIFKMNGDINDLNNATVTRKDLESYDETHSVLLSFFKRELVVKTFLFIGYSFTDSLVLPCIADLNRIFGDKQSYHYNIVKKEDTPGFENFIRDLEDRYKIRTLLIDEYDEIPGILREINYITNKHNVFISGSYNDNDPQKLLEISNFCETLTNKLYQEQYRIINGYGFKVGYYIASAATKIMLEQNVTSFEKYLLMYPFSEHLTDKKKTVHREFMINKSNVAIFMYGNSNSNGMIEEFYIAQKDPRKIIIPIGSSGGAAKIIFDQVRTNLTNYPYLENYIEILEKETDPEKLTGTILSIIKEALSN